MFRILIKNVCILFMEFGIGDLSRGEVLVDGDCIAEVVPRVMTQADRVIDAEGAIVLSGFINAHIHMWEIAMRGIGADWAGSDYFSFFYVRLAFLYMPVDTFIGTLVGTLGQLDVGVITIYDWCYNNSMPVYTDAVVDVLFVSGARALFGYGTVKPHPKLGEPYFS